MFQIHAHGQVAPLSKSKKNFFQKLVEDAAEDEDVHLQSAHDAVRSRIAKHKRMGKDTKSLETRLASIAGLIGKKD